jgi:hypothetical protein
MDIIENEDFESRWLPLAMLRSRNVDSLRLLLTPIGKFRPRDLTPATYTFNYTPLSEFDQITAPSLRRGSTHPGRGKWHV